MTQVKPVMLQCDMTIELVEPMAFSDVCDWLMAAGISASAASVQLPESQIVRSALGARGARDKAVMR